MKGKLVVVEGLIGAGKSSFCHDLGKLLEPHVEVFLEPDEKTTETNPYLADFYSNPSRWAFTMQIHLMQARFRSHMLAQDALETGEHAILDRSIYADTEFARLQEERGTMSRYELRTYLELYENLLSPEVQTPDLVVWLDVSVETAVRRIQKRAEERTGRRCESAIDTDYLRGLDRRFHGMLGVLEDRGIAVHRVDWEEDRPHQEDRAEVVGEVRERIDG